MIKHPLLPYNMQVLGGNYMPYFKSMYLETGKGQWSKKFSDKIFDLVVSHNQDDNWLLPSSRQPMEIRLQNIRSAELNKHFRPNQINYTDLNRIIGEQKVFSQSNRVEKELLRAIQQVDDEAILLDI
jgi:hypothetical protein